MSVVLEDGSRHVLRLKGYPDISGDGFYAFGAGKQIVDVPGCVSVPAPEMPPAGNLTYFTDDGSFVKVVVQDAPSGTPWFSRIWVITIPDGTTVTGMSDRMSGMVDRNGNAVSVYNTFDLSGNPVRSYEDAAGRRIEMTHELASGWRVKDTIKRKAYGGVNDLVWTVNWGTRLVGPLGYECTVDHDLCVDSITHEVVNSIDVPDVETTTDLKYTFGYSDNSKGGWGELDLIKFPSNSPGAPALSYTYLMQNSNRVYVDRLYNPVSSRTLANGGSNGIGEDEVWQYAYPSNTTTKITAPDGGVTDYFYTDRTFLSLWNRGLVHEVRGPHGSGVRRVWGQNKPFLTIETAGPYAGNPYVKAEFQLMGTDSSAPTGLPLKMTGRQYKQDKNGNLTELNEHDWESYSGSPTTPTGTLIRTTTKSYYAETAVNVDGQAPTTDDSQAYWSAGSAPYRSAVFQVKVRDGGSGGTVKAFTEYTYDAALYSANIVEERRWDSVKSSSVPTTAMNATNAAVTWREYSGALLTKVKDPWQFAQSSRGYTEYVYEGIQCPPPGPVSLYPTQIKAAVGVTPTIERKRVLTYDCAAGVPRSDSDFNNSVVTIYDYDPLGRRKSENVGGRWFRTPIEDGKRWFLSERDLNTQDDGKLMNMIHYDFLGRVRLQRRTDDAGTALDTDTEVEGVKTETAYYRSAKEEPAASEKFNWEAISNPYRGTTPENERGWTRTKRDRLGRVIEVESFSGSTKPKPWSTNVTSTGKVTTAYTTEQIQVVDQASKSYPFD
jgi:hypothetical protein